MEKPFISIFRIENVATISKYAMQNKQFQHENSDSEQETKTSGERKNNNNKIKGILHSHCVYL